ncbi:roadblock/LC7 domain-containing protein [Caldimonas brevitalea]|nr:hypothetical protein [Caldimonas brevitalea]
MLTSLFGDLGAPAHPPRRVRRPSPEGSDFAATAILESVATEVNDRGQMVDKHTRDLFVVGSPAEAIRQHLVATRSDLGVASRQITLFDPARLWAGSVIKALSDASGQPIERLHLRHQTTLATIAQIERTSLPRRVDEPLKIYHTDVRQLSAEALAVPIALMESSHLTAVVVTPASAHELDDMLGMLHAATKDVHWRCPNLLFMLCAQTGHLAARIAEMRWPNRLNVQVTNEPMTSASGVWNSVLSTWNRVKTRSQWDQSKPAPALGVSEFPIKVAELGMPIIGTVKAVDAAAAVAPVAVQVDTLHNAPDATRVARTLSQLMQVEGVLGCCIADMTTGLLLGSEVAPDVESLHLELAAASQTEVMKAHRRAARDMGCGERVDEIFVTHGRRHLVLRTVTAHPELFVLAVLDKQRVNLALARYKIMDAEKALG